MSTAQTLSLSIPGLPFTIDNTLGAVLVGFAISCVIFGILCTQAYVYYERYPEDRYIYKIFVGIILALETADQAFIGHIVYFYTIVSFANIPVVLRASVTWSFITQLLVGSIVGTLVKTAFALRVWRFSKGNYWITGLILILTWGQFGVALMFAIKSFALPSVFDVVRLRVLGTIGLGIGVATDLVTAAALSYYLLKLRTGYHKSDTLVRNLIRYAINTGFLTSAVSLTTLVLYNIMPNNLIFIAVYFALSKMYAISFMATLTTRKIVRGRGTDKQGTTSASHYPNSNHPSSRQHAREVQTNGTNLFHLGTRIVPIMSEIDIDEWELAETGGVAGVGVKVDVERNDDGYSYPPMPATKERVEKDAYNCNTNDVHAGYPSMPSPPGQVRTLGSMRYQLNQDPQRQWNGGDRRPQAI